MKQTKKYYQMTREEFLPIGIKMSKENASEQPESFYVSQASRNHHNMVRRSLISGDLTQEQAETIGHFKDYPELKEQNNQEPTTIVPVICENTTNLTEIIADNELKAVNKFVQSMLKDEVIQRNQEGLPDYSQEQIELLNSKFQLAAIKLIVAVKTKDFNQLLSRLKYYNKKTLRLFSDYTGIIHKQLTNNKTIKQAVRSLDSVGFDKWEDSKKPVEIEQKRLTPEERKQKLQDSRINNYLSKVSHYSVRGILTRRQWLDALIAEGYNIPVESPNINRTAISKIKYNMRWDEVKLKGRSDYDAVMQDYQNQIDKLTSAKQYSVKNTQGLNYEVKKLDYDYVVKQTNNSKQGA